VNVLWLDKYERQARLVPGLLALLPVAVTITALGLRHAPVVSVVVSILSLAGGPVLLADTIRGLGLKEQDHLWTTWGGAPTTIALRLREATSNEVQRDIWRKAIKEVTRIQLASARSEAVNPSQADQKIEAAVSRIREVTRYDQRFYMVQVENRGYGYRRNFYAVRNLGRLVALLGLAIILGFILWPVISGKHPDVQAAYILGSLVDAVIAAGWYVLPSTKGVRQAGDKYAHQLLHAGVTLATEAGSRKNPADDQAQ
jgi:hypothetical protein